MELEFYPYDFEYVVQDKVFVRLYAKLKDGKKICVQHEHTPFFYATTNNVNKPEFEKKLNNLTIDNSGEPAKVISFEMVKKNLIGFEQEYYKIYTNYPKATPILAKKINSWGVECFEKAINFIHQYLRNVNITPMTLVKANGEYTTEHSKLQVPLFLATSVEQKDVNDSGTWKILALDIETYAKKREIDPQVNPILMVGLYGVDNNNKKSQKVFTWKKFSHEHSYIEHCATEKEMLERTVQFIKEFDPDIITGYFSDGFDFPYIADRARILKVPVDLGLNNSRLQIQKNQGFRQGQAKITGILHIDIFKFVKYIFGQNLKTDSFKLDSVASELLNKKKHVVNLDDLAGTWDNNPELLEPYAAYNLEDAKLTFELCDKLLFDVIEFVKVVGLPPFDVNRMRFSRLVESYIMKRGTEKNYNALAPNRPEDKVLAQRMRDSIEGAFVFSPKPGLYSDIVIFDFRSLYPTIISSHNLGPGSYHNNNFSKKTTIPDRKEFWFSDKKAFLPTILKDLILKRSEIKQEIKTVKKQGLATGYLEARSYAFKILANSFYGYLCFYGARWYSIESAASTTAFARHYIKTTIEKARDNGFDVVYGDTDSVFFKLDGKSLDDAMDFMKEINKHLPGIMELEFEGYFKKGLFVAQKGSSTKGAKKKYALIDKNNKLKITGFEVVRRNWSPLAKKVQKEVLQLVLEGKVEDALTYAQSVLEELLSGKISKEDLILKTQLTRELSKYSSVGPHVKIAREMQDKGFPVQKGMVIEYIITKGTGIIRDRAKIPGEVKEGEYDKNYYCNNQLIPALSSIFEVLGYSEDQLLKKPEQKGLGNFF